MSDHSPFSGVDLSSLFMPSWAKEGDQKHPLRFADQKEEKKGSHSRSSFSSRGGETRRDARRSSGPSRNNDRSRDERFRERREERPVISQLSGWQLQLLPDARGMDEMAKQIRMEMKAYPLFELTRLILEKPERYQLKLNRILDSTEKVTPLFQCLVDGGLWPSEQELLAHAFKQHRDHYYRLERITVDPPKGSYSSVGICGMSQTLLGPPNHHEYQNKVRQLHAQRFSNIPFEVFKSRIQTVRDEALLEKWKEEQSCKDEFYSLEVPEGSEPEKFTTVAEVEAHFKKQHAAGLIKEVEKEVIFSSQEGLKQSSPLVQRFVQQVIDYLKRVPLPFSHEVGQELAARGLQIFKAHENIVYASLARPRALNRKETAVADTLIALLDTLEAHRKSPRAEQWKALIASRSLLEGESESARESAVAKDLSWLIHEGYVTNYALRGFEVTRRTKLSDELFDKLA